MDCMKNANGLQMYFSEESAPAANLHVRYGGPPTSQLHVSVDIIGGTLHGIGNSWRGSIPAGGEQSFIAVRSDRTAELRAIANGTGLSAEAVSLPRPAAITLEATDFASAAGAGPAIQAQLQLYGKVLLAYDEAGSVTYDFKGSDAEYVLAARFATGESRPFDVSGERSEGCYDRS